MSSEELARKIAKWTGSYGFCGKVHTQKVGDNYVVWFEARTTKTRASSMATRVRLMADEVIVGTDFVVGKELMGDAPKERGLLATWRIFVAISVRKRKKEAA